MLTDEETVDLDRFNELRDSLTLGFQLSDEESTELIMLEVKLGL